MGGKQADGHPGIEADRGALPGVEPREAVRIDLPYLPLDGAAALGGEHHAGIAVELVEAVLRPGAGRPNEALAGQEMMADASALECAV